MTARPILVLDTCSLRHLDELTLSRRPIVNYMLSAFDIRVPPEVFDEIKRHLRGMEEAKKLREKKAEWRRSLILDDDCLKRLLPDLPDTPDWYPHRAFHPSNQAHLFAPGRNAGERQLLLLYLELCAIGYVPILLSDDLKASRLAMRDLTGWKLKSGPLWITLDLIIYLVLTGLKRYERKKIVNRFLLRDVEMVIRDLVLRISATKELQQQLLTHYTQLARTTFQLVDSSEGFDRLERKYANHKYR